MTHIGNFPFGNPVRPVAQSDRSPRKAFVLGVYASAVHARWLSPEGHTRVRALAVASEPYIFWRGDEAASIIREIRVPSEVGQLIPAAPQFNGPSGVALDETILKPLGLSRRDAWLCDLVPHSCVNPAQQRAIEREYLPIAEQFSLPLPSVPSVPSILADDERRRQILEEFRESQAETLILLGDQPIRWFLAHFDGSRRKLRDFGTTTETYGRLHRCDIAGYSVHVLPIAHPRQVARLGRSSIRWYELHQLWRREVAVDLLD